MPNRRTYLQSVFMFIVLLMAMVSLAFGQTPAVPAPAAAVGYNTLTFGPSIKINPGVQSFNNGQNWVQFSYLGTTWLNIGVVVNSDGSISMDGSGQGYGNGLTTGSPVYGTYNPLNMIGQAFGGGGYFQATMKSTGTMSFWANDAETMNGGSFGIGPHPWPGQPYTFTVYLTSGATLGAGDVLGMVFVSPSNSAFPLTVPYTVKSGDTLSTVASSWAAAINANTTLAAAGITASASGTSCANISGCVSAGNIQVNSPNTLDPGLQLTYTYSGTGTESITWTAPYGDWIENDMAEFDSVGGYGGAVHNWLSNANGGVAVSTVGSGSTFSSSTGTNCCPGADFTQYHDYGFLWVPATSTTQGYVKWFFDGNQVGNTITWNQYNKTNAPPPVDLGRGGSTAYSVMDRLHMIPILGGGAPGTTTTVSKVQIWQASAANNIGSTGTVTPPTFTESSNNTVVTTVGPVITDANGNTFSLSSGGSVVINGTVDASTKNVIELAYVNHVLWQENSTGSWYNYLGTPGSYGGPTVSPFSGSSGGKIPPPAPLTGTVPTQTWVAYDQNFTGVVLPSGKPFHFNVLPPAQDNETAYKYPLLIWLHPTFSGNAWYTGANTDPFFYIPNEPAQFNTVPFLTAYPGYVAVPYADQTCSAGDAVCNWGGWVNNGLTGSATVNSGDTGPNVFAVLAMVNYLESIYSIDPTRVYVNGFSLGGIGAEYLMQKYNAYNGSPAVFAAGASTGGVLEYHGFGAGPTSADATTMASVPVWWFSGANDTTSIPADWNLPMWRLEAGNSSYPAAITSPSANQAANTQMHFTLCPTCGHQDTDAAGAPVWTNSTIMNWMYGTTATAAQPGTGAFVVSNGNIIGPTGKNFKAAGINILWNASTLATYCPTSACSYLKSTFPGINFIRVVYEEGYGTQDLEPYITYLTNLGIVVAIGDFNLSPSSPPPSPQTTQVNWYASLAASYKNNPYVWFESQNEMYAAGSVIATAQQAIYNAVRGAGNTNPVLLDPAGGGTYQTVGINGTINGSTMTASVYAAMTNVIWDLHFYGYIVNRASGSYSTDPTVIQSALLGSVAGAYGILAAQSITSKDGVMPVILGECGNSTSGTAIDPDGSQVVNAAGTSGYGFAMFASGYGSSIPGNQITDSNTVLTSPYGTQVVALITAATAGSTTTTPETLSINTISTVTPSTPFTVSGNIVGASAAPVLQYQNNNGTWNSMPSGATVSNVGFSFTDPGIVTAGSSGNTVSVRDAGTTSIVATSNGFNVTSAESANNSIVTASLTAPTFSDNFSSLSLHRTWQAGDNWQLIAPDTPDGRGGPSFNEAGDQWWTNPYNPSTPISGIYVQDSGGLHLGLLGTPSAQQTYITNTAGSALPYVGGLMNTSQTNYQKYGYWEITASVPNTPGFSFQADAENVQITGQFPPEIDLRISTAQNGVSTVLYEFALGGGQYTQWTTTSLAGFDITKSHTYAWDWEAATIAFYIDGVQVASYANPSTAYTTNPMFLFLLSGANYIGNGDPASSALPVAANVTSVNIYATKPAAVSSGSIVDSVGEVWTITSGGQVAVNGAADTTTSGIVELAYVNHAVWKKSNTGLWQYKTKASDTWQPVPATTVSPLTINESPTNTVVTTVGPTITDANGNTFAITSGGQVSINGTADTSTSTVVELAYVNHVLWQKNAAGNWYNYLGTPGSYGGPTTTSPLPAESLTVNTIATQTTGVAFPVTGTITGTSTAPSLQYLDSGTTTTTTVTVPPQAAAVGYNTLTFGPSITLGPSGVSDPATGRPIITSTSNWFPFTFYGNTWTKTAAGITQNSDGSVSMNGANQTFGNGLSSAMVGSASRTDISGIAFGGGAYFEATMASTGPFSFWANDIETMNGSSLGWGANPWPGQPMTVTIAGTMTASDVLSLTFRTTAITGTPLVISHTVTGSETPTTVASALVTAVNANSVLSAAAVTATSSAGVITINSPNTLSPGLSMLPSETGSGSETMALVSYGDWMETDFAEFDSTGVYGGAMHNWYANGNPPPAIDAVSGSPFSNITPTPDFTKPHKYGFLWVPATGTAASSTNIMPNSALAGAVVGTPGTLPTGFAVFTTGGLSYAVTATGTDGTTGNTYIKLHVFGTPDGSGDFEFGPPQIAASSSTNYTLSTGLSIAAGSMTNAGTFLLIANNVDANGNYLSGALYQGVTLTGTQAVDTGTFVTSATAKKVGTAYSLSGMTTGAAVDVTIQMENPQLLQPASQSGVQGYAKFYFDGTQVGNTMTWNKNNPAKAPPPSLSDGSATSIIDTLHMALILGGSSGSTNTISGVQVWQASGVNNISTLTAQQAAGGANVTTGSSGGSSSGTWNTLPVGSTVTPTTFSFTNPPLATSPTNTVSVRDSASQGITASSNGFAVVASEVLGINAVGNQTVNTAFTVTGTIMNVSSAPTLQYQNNNGTWANLPTGSTVTPTSFTFTNPGLAANAAATVSIRDAASPTVVTTATFVVALAGANGVTWNPTDTSTSVTLSNNNQVATSTAVSQGGSRVVGAQSTGKYCYDMLVNTMTANLVVGLSNRNYLLAGTVTLGANANGVGFYPATPGLSQGSQYNGVQILPPTTAVDVSGDSITICVDLTAQKEWVSTPAMRNQNGASLIWNSALITNANPATGVGGVSFSGLTCPCYPTFDTKDVSTQVTVNTAGPLAVTLPTGFQFWQPPPVIQHHPFIFNFGQTKPANDDNVVPVRFERMAR